MKTLFFCFLLVVAKRLAKLSEKQRIQVRKFEILVLIIEEWIYQVFVENGPWNISYWIDYGGLFQEYALTNKIKIFAL